MNLPEKPIYPSRFFKQNLSKEPSKEPHTCPYREELYKDENTLCNCSPYDTHQCAMDI